MFTTLSVLGVFLATQISKKWIVPKFGDTGVHVFAFIIAFAIVSVKGLATTYPPLQDILLTAGQYLVSSLALYKIIIKPLADNLGFNIPVLFN